VEWSGRKYLPARALHLDAMERRLSQPMGRTQQLGCMMVERLHQRTQVPRTASSRAVE